MVLLGSAGVRGSRLLYSHLKLLLGQLRWLGTPQTSFHSKVFRLLIFCLILVIFFFVCILFCYETVMLLKAMKHVWFRFQSLPVLDDTFVRIWCSINDYFLISPILLHEFSSFGPSLTSQFKIENFFLPWNYTCLWSDFYFILFFFMVTITIRHITWFTYLSVTSSS